MSGNPSGRPKLPDDIRAIRQASTEQIARAYNKFAYLDIQQINLVKPENLLESGILRALVDFAQKGNPENIRHIWDQVHGKPKQVNEYGGIDGMPIDLNLKINWG